MSIELHAFDTPNGRKISVALEEMGLPYTVRIVDIRKGQQREPDFLKISPNGKTPRLSTPTVPMAGRSASSSPAQSSSTSAKRPASSGRAIWRRVSRCWNG